MIGYIVALIVRWIDVKRLVNIRIDTNNTIILMSAVCVQFALYYVPGTISYVIRIILFALIIFVERKTVFILLKKGK